jgi:hypothetical protein
MQRVLSDVFPGGFGVSVGEMAVSQGVEFVEGWKAGRGIRDLLNSQENKAKRVTAAPFHVAVSKDVVFEDVERARSRTGTQRR